jgi:hypothetical protein
MAKQLYRGDEQREAEVVMITTNTKRLSTDRLFSTMWPAKYWAPNPQPTSTPNTTPNPIATAT